MILGQTFHGDDLGSIAFRRQHHAAIDRFAVQHHRACAALPRCAAVFCAGQGKFFPQHSQQGHVRGNINLLFGSIHR